MYGGVFILLDTKNKNKMIDIRQQDKIRLYESDLHEYISERLNPQKLHLIICRKGYAVFSFNQQKRAVAAGCLLMISSDLITTVVQTSRTFLADCLDVMNDIVQEAILTVNPDLLMALYYNPVIQIDKVEFSLLLEWFKQFQWSLDKVHPLKTAQLVRNNLQSLFFVLEKLYPYDKYTDIKGISSQNKLFLDFCALICEKCHQEHNVRFYADKLCITPYYLSKITRRMADVTPKRMIDEQLIAEIKHLLIHTDKTIKELSSRFYFDSTSYFCKFFKRYTGKSPSDYRALTISSV